MKDQTNTTNTTSLVNDFERIASWEVTTSSYETTYRVEDAKGDNIVDVIILVKKVNELPFVEYKKTSVYNVRGSDTAALVAEFMEIYKIKSLQHEDYEYCREEFEPTI